MGVPQPSDPLQPLAMRFKVRGRVQGVGFRYTTRRLARQLGVVGWVRNLPSGAVEVLAQGAPQALEELHAFLEQGPRGAFVEAVTPGDAEFDPRLTSFDIAF